MTSASTLGTPALPTLPHWETPPADLKAAIREVQGRAACPHRRVRTHGRGGLRRHRSARRRAGGRDRGGEAARRDGLAGDRLRRYRGRHRLRRRAGQAPPPRLPRRARSLPARAGHCLGPGHRRLRGAQPVLRELPRPGRRLLRQRRFQARDLPRLLVARTDGPARATGWPACRPSSTASGAASLTACSGSTPTATRSTPTASAAGPRAPTPAGSAPTSTPAPSTCG